MKLTKIIIILLAFNSCTKSDRKLNAYDYYFPFNDTLSNLEYHYEECFTSNGVDSMSQSYLRIGKLQANRFSFKRYDAFKHIISKSEFHKTPNCFQVIDDQIMIAGMFYKSELEPNCIYHSNINKQHKLSQLRTLNGPDFVDSTCTTVIYNGTEKLDQPFRGEDECLKFSIVQNSNFIFHGQSYLSCDTIIIYDLKNIGMYKLIERHPGHTKTVKLKKITKAHNNS